MKLIPNYIKVLFLIALTAVIMSVMTSCAATTPASVQQKDDRQYNATHPAAFRE